jgi:hypothetical protein
MLEAGWSVFSNLKVSRELRGYGDVAVLSELGAKRFLVTSGFRRLQESKIAALGLSPLFTAIYVEAIDEQDRLARLLGGLRLALATYTLVVDVVTAPG